MYIKTVNIQDIYLCAYLMDMNKIVWIFSHFFFHFSYIYIRVVKYFIIFLKNYRQFVLY